MVLQWLRKGVPFFWHNPSALPRPWHKGVSCANLSAEERAFVEKEKERSFATGAWETGSRRRYVSKMFLVPKPD